MVFILLFVFLVARRVESPARGQRRPGSATGKLDT